MTEKPIEQTVKRTSKITIELGYTDHVTPEFISVDVKGSAVDLILAREALANHIADKIDNPCQLLCDAFEEMAKSEGLHGDPNQKDGE